MRRSSTAIRRSASSIVGERGYSGAVQTAASAVRARRWRRTRLAATNGAEAAPRPASAQSRSGKCLPAGQDKRRRAHAERSHRLPSYSSSTLARKHQSRVEFLRANGGCAASSIVRCMFVRTAVCGERHVGRRYR